jgi:exopolysaccharide production protein ExoZ
MLINVQFLRFVAAMLVVLYHTSSHVRDAGVDQGLFFAVNEAIGFAGVDIFFVISGFIMAHTTHSSAGIGAGWSFARRRLARIYSGYWPFYLLALCLFSWINPSHVGASSLLSSFLLWPSNQLLIAVSWTLIFEMFFYLLYTLLVSVSGPRRNRLLKALLLFVACWSMYSQYFRHAYDPGHLEYISLAEYYMLSPYLAEFLAGAVAATWLRRRAGTGGWAWLLAGAGLFLCAGWINVSLFGGEIEQGYYVLFRVLAFGIPSLMLLIGLVRLEQAGRQAPIGFSLLAGGASYAVYLSHTLLLATSQHLGMNAFAGSLGATAAQWLFALYALLILAYSMMHYRLLERPLHRVCKRILQVTSTKA